MKSLRTPIMVCISVLAAFPIVSCKKKKDPLPTNHGWFYNGKGDDDIKETHTVNVNYTVQSNLNVNGTATLSTSTLIKNDLNLNDNGKVLIQTKELTDTIYINGNINVNDSLIIRRGVVKLAHDFNINSTGIVVCYSEAKVIVSGNLNQSGTLWGNKYIIANTKNINRPEQTHEEPLE